MQEHRKNKAINQCFLYSKFNNYTKVMSSAIMESERIDKDTQVFMEDVALELKRSKAPSYLLKVLTSKNTHLIYPKDPLPRSLRVFCAKDIKNKGSKPNIFIDCTGIIVKRDNERYKCKIDTLMAYLITAKNNMIYYSIPDAFGEYRSPCPVRVRRDTCRLSCGKRKPRRIPGYPLCHDRCRLGSIRQLCCRLLCRQTGHLPFCQQQMGQDVSTESGKSRKK